VPFIEKRKLVRASCARAVTVCDLGKKKQRERKERFLRATTAAWLSLMLSYARQECALEREGGD